MPDAKIYFINEEDKDMILNEISRKQNQNEHRTHLKDLLAAVCLFLIIFHYERLLTLIYWSFPRMDYYYKEKKLQLNTAAM